MPREKEVGELLKRLEALEAEAVRLRADVARLKNARLEAENTELRRLAKDSTNSHKPPSSDGYRKKPRQTSAMPKKEKRSQGGPKGHRGRTLRQVVQPDQIQVYLPHYGATCGRENHADEPHRVVSKRQVFDLPELKLEVTEHRVGEMTCCGVPQQGEYAAYVTAPVQYGPGVQALATQLSVAHNMPLGEIGQLFADTYGQEAEVAHFDETGIRVAGSLHWLLVASDVRYAYLFVHTERGRKALESEQSILPEYRGWSIHDCWASCFKFEQAHHGLCNAHLLRDLQGPIEEEVQWAQAMRKHLVALYKQGQRRQPASAIGASSPRRKRKSPRPTNHRGRRDRQRTVWGAT